MMELIKSVKSSRDRVGLNLNLQENYSNEHRGKSKHLLEGEHISTETNYKFLVVLTINDSYTNEEIKKRISFS